MSNQVLNVVPAASNVVSNSATVGTPQVSTHGDGNLSAQASEQLRTLNAFWSALSKSLRSLLSRNPDVMLLLKRASARVRMVQLKHLVVKICDAVQKKFNALVSVAKKTFAQRRKLMSTTVAAKVGDLSQFAKQEIRKALSSIETTKGTFLQLIKFSRTQLRSILPPVKGKVSEFLQLVKCKVSKVRDAIAKKILNNAQRLSSKLCNTLVKAKTVVQQIKKHGTKVFKILASIATNKLYDGRQLVLSKWTQLLIDSKELVKCIQLKMRFIVKIMKVPTKILRTNPECIFYEHCVINDDGMCEEQIKLNPSVQVNLILSYALAACFFLFDVGKILNALLRALVQPVVFLAQRLKGVVRKQLVTPQFDKLVCPFGLQISGNDSEGILSSTGCRQLHGFSGNEFSGKKSNCTSLILYQPIQTIADLLPCDKVCIPSIHKQRFVHNVGQEILLNMLTNSFSPVLRDSARSLASKNSRCRIWQTGQQ